MELTELCRGIGLAEEAEAMLCLLEKSDKDYDVLRTLYQRDREGFYRKIYQRDEPEKLLLYYYSRFACDAYEAYREREIGDGIYFDTFRDIAIWCGEYFRRTGKYGLGSYVRDWFWRGFEIKLLRLGRLEFEEMEAEEEIQGESLRIGKGEPVISIHIPEGEPLREQACRESIEEAYRRYGRERRYFCHSWLLFPGLKEILPEDSNILRFQKLFDIVKMDFREREAEQRIFGAVFSRPADYPEETSLQRQAKRYLLSGRSLGNGWGIF